MKTVLLFFFGLILTATPVSGLDITDIISRARETGKERQVRGKGSDVMSGTPSELEYELETISGDNLAVEGFRRYGMPVKDSEVQKYVSLLGNAVARNTNCADSPFYFVVVESELFSSFACPGGIIFVTSAFIRHMNDESELAGLLGHEIAHLCHKHLLRSVKNVRLSEDKPFQDMIGYMKTNLFDQGLGRDMEFEADTSAMEAVYRTGYDPGGLIRVLKMLETKQNSVAKKDSWFSAHPSLSDRIIRAQENMNNYPDSAEMAKVKKRFEKRLSDFCRIR